MWFVVEFGLVSLSGGGLPWFVGHECRSALISLFSLFDVGLGGVLHEGVDFGGVRRSVYSLRPLTFTSGFKVVFPSGFSRFSVDGNVVFTPRASAVLGVTLFDEGVASKLVSLLVTKAQGVRLNVKGYEFSVEKVSFSVVDPIEFLNAQPEDVDEIDVNFLTPTYFNPLQGDMKYKVIVPDITLMLASQIALLHRTLGLNLPKPEELSSEAFLSGVDVKTPYIKELSSEAPTGFVGWAKIRFKEGTKPETRKLITGLIKLGEITNLGGNRSGGFGVVKVKLAKKEKTKEKVSNMEGADEVKTNQPS